MDEENTILKQDVLGRVRVPKERREELLDIFEASGMSGRAFAEQHGIHIQTFASWIQKRRRARGDYEDEGMRRSLRMGKKAPSKTSRTPQPEKSSVLPSLSTPLNLVEVELEASSQSEALEIVLPCGAVVKLISKRQIGLLKSLLNGLSC